MLPERQVISQIAVKYVRHVVITEAVILINVVDVLLEGYIGAGLACRRVAISSVIALVVCQTFRPGVVRLECKPAAQTSLECELEGIVILPANGRVEPDLASSNILQSWISRQVRSWSNGPVRKKNALAGVQDRCQMVGVLSDIGRLERHGIPKLSLDRQVPLIGNRWSIVVILHVDAYSGEARCWSGSDGVDVARDTA